MGLFGVVLSGGLGRGCGWWSAVALVGLCCGGVACCGDAGGACGWVGCCGGWRRAARCEAEPGDLRRGAHTREEFARVMNSFRAIYHADPGNAHAAEAVAQVAELLDEQGREFGDKKSVHDAAGQYEFLAKAYPGDRLARRRWRRRWRCWGLQDADEAGKVREQLVQDYPREARRDGVEAEALSVSSPTSRRRDVGHPGSGDSYISMR